METGTTNLVKWKATYLCDVGGLGYLNVEAPSRTLAWDAAKVALPVEAARVVAVDRVPGQTEPVHYHRPVLLAGVKVSRADLCGCGCGGADPWHKASYRRTVSVMGTDDTGRRWGTVRLPMSTQPVQVVENDFGGWTIDRSSIEYDK